MSSSRLLISRSSRAYLLWRITAVLGCAAFTCATAVVVAPAAGADPGVLDPSFGIGGIASSHQGNYVDFGMSATDVTVQDDGKVVVVGGGYPEPQAAIVRFTRDGSLDARFSGDGKQLIDFPRFIDGIGRVISQDDGKLLLVGSTCDNGSGGYERCDLALARLNPDGSLDTSFSGDGRATLAIGTGAVRTLGADAAVRPNGQIMVVGTTDTNLTPPGSRFLARLTPDGALDTSFASGGSTLTPGQDNGNGSAAIALASDGKIVTGDYYALLRYRENGSLDTDFGSNGVANLNPGGFGGGQAALALAPNGAVYAALNGGRRFLMARYSPAGQRDMSFGVNGDAAADFVSTDELEFTADLTIQSDGKVLAVGGFLTPGVASSNSAARWSALARFNPDGSLDASFSGDGKVMTSFRDSFNSGSGVAIAPDGRIVTSLWGTDLAAARYGPGASAPPPPPLPPPPPPAPSAPGPGPGPTPNPGPTPGPATSCGPRIEVIGVRGSGEEGGTPEYFGKPVGAFRKRLRADATKIYGKAWMASQWEDHGVGYGAVPVPFAITMPGIYWASKTLGASFVKSTLRSGYRDCKQTRYVLAGYSQGAHAIGDALSSNLEAVIRKRIIAVVLFGDPKFNPDESRFSRFGSYEDSYAGILGPRPKGSLKGPKSDYPARTYCRALDPVCQGRQKLFGGFGIPIANAFTDRDAHSKYHGTYADDAATWVAKLVKTAVK